MSNTATVWRGRHTSPSMVFQSWSWGFYHSPSRVKRETLSGMDSVHGYKEKPTPGFISMRVRDSGGTTVADFMIKLM